MTRRTSRVSCPCFWRIQDAGFPLSQSHRSETYSEDDDDDGEKHEGTSAVRTVAKLASAQANLMGDGRPVEIVRFEGEEVGTGWDGEPVVIPTRELLRLRKDNPQRKPGTAWLGLTRVTSIRGLLESGWKEVPRMKVLGS